MLFCAFLNFYKEHALSSTPKSTFHPEEISGENRLEGVWSKQSVDEDCNGFLEEL